MSAEGQVGEPAGEQVEADRPQRAAVDDRRPGTSPVEDAPADLGHDHEPEEEVSDVQARLGGALSERDLRVDAGEEEERHEHDRHQAEHDRLHREAAVAEDLQPQQRVGGAQLPRDEGEHQHEAHHDATPRLDAAPAPHARLLQPEHVQSHRPGDQNRPAVVELRGVDLVVRPGPPDQQEGDDRDGNAIQKIDRQVHWVR
jgi:hypothetical protein